MTRQTVLLVGGTTESSQIYRRLTNLGYAIHVSTVTDHVGHLYPGADEGTIHRGPLGSGGFKRLIEKEHVKVVIDASHPFAVSVTHTLRQVTETLEMPYFRYEREGGDSLPREITMFDEVGEAVRFLSETEGPIFVTTGVRALPRIVEKIDRTRLLVRVLPSVASIATCHEMGLSIGQILAAKGPFTEAFNRVVMEDHGIKWLLTKESGRHGGLTDKIKAAQGLGISIVMVRRPQVPGDAYACAEDLLKALAQAMADRWTD